MVTGDLWMDVRLQESDKKAKMRVLSSIKANKMTNANGSHTTVLTASCSIHTKPSVFMKMNAKHAADNSFSGQLKKHQAQADKERTAARGFINDLNKQVAAEKAYHDSLTPTDNNDNFRNFPTTIPVVETRWIGGGRGRASTPVTNITYMNQAQYEQYGAKKATEAKVGYYVLNTVSGLIVVASVLTAQPEGLEGAAIARAAAMSLLKRATVVKFGAGYVANTSAFYIKNGWSLKGYSKNHAIDGIVSGTQAAILPAPAWGLKNTMVSGVQTILIVDGTANIGMAFKEGRKLSMEELKDNTQIAGISYVGGFAIQNVFHFKYLPGNLAVEVNKILSPSVARSISISPKDAAKIESQSIADYTKIAAKYSKAVKVANEAHDFGLDVLAATGGAIVTEVRTAQVEEEHKKLIESQTEFGK